MNLIALYPWFVTFLSLLGASLASSGKRNSRKWGYIIWVVSNALIGYGFYLDQNWAQTLLFLVGYQVFNFRGIWNNK
jgi:hypothetical protein